MKLQKRVNDSTIEQLCRYIQAGGKSGDVALSDKHLELLDRARFADEKLRENKYKREEIARFIIGKYNVCRDTAYKDIVTAEAVFSSSYPLNKKYEIGARIEHLKKEINKAYTDSDRLGAAVLEKILQKYLEQYPDYTPPKSPKNLIFMIQNNIHTTQDQNLNIEAAEAKFDQILKDLEEKEDY